ncbi:MAG: hypothetical protein IKT40_12720 [Bacilli bacterium]|nr:hypothetical protein [Bacilli bacterium]
MKKRIINWDIEMLNSIHDFFYDLDTKEAQRKVGDETKKEDGNKVEEPNKEDEKKGGSD